MHDFNVIEMSRRYPFDKEHRPPTLVHLRRRYKEHEYQDIRAKIDIHSRLPNTHIIQIQKGFESRKNKYFDVFLEHIPISLKQTIHSLSISELRGVKQSLLNLCVFLLQRGIYPIITEDSLGMHEGNLKYYLDIDFSKVVGSVEELAKAKSLEISSIFNVYQQIINGAAHKISSNFLENKTKAESTLKNISQYSSHLRSPRYPTQRNESQENSMTATQKNLGANRLHYQSLTNFVVSRESLDLIQRNPYVSSRSSLLPIFQKQHGTKQELPSAQILSQSKNIREASEQIDEVIEEAMANPSQPKYPYNELIRLQRCESQTKVEHLASDHFQQPRQHRYQFHHSIKMTDSRSRKFSADNNRQMPYNPKSFLPIQQKQQTRKKKESLYHQAFGHKNDHLTKQFNTLFDNDSLLPSESKDEQFSISIKKDLQEEIREVREQNEEKIYALKKERMKKQKFDMREINNRVRKALEKSELVLESFRGVQ